MSFSFSPLFQRAVSRESHPNPLKVMTWWQRNSHLLLDMQAIPTWTFLKPAEMKSEGGATFTLVGDGSVLASGPNPDHDSYTLVCPTSLTNIVAVRLEALPDPSLPHNGPGRAQGNGNIALSEWKVTAEPQKPGETPRVIRWKDAWSDQQLQLALARKLAVGGKHHPKAVMLQFRDGTNWEHRAFWGEDVIFLGAGGKENHLAMGPLPKAGAWVRLEVEVARVGLSAGAVLDGWSFTQHGGTCYWDAAGCTNFFETPWHKLAAAYHRLGDQQALDALVKHHPEASSGIGDLYAASGDWEGAIAEYGKLVTDRPEGATLVEHRSS